MIRGWLYSLVGQGMGQLSGRGGAALSMKSLSRRPTCLLSSGCWSPSKRNGLKEKRLGPSCAQHDRDHAGRRS